jgi:hypothetical protein
MHSSVIINAMAAGVSWYGSGIIPAGMSLFFFKRLITLIATLVGTSVVVFLVLEILPGNAAQMLMGPDASPEAVAALAQKLGLDRPGPGPLLGMDHRHAAAATWGLSYAYSTPWANSCCNGLALTGAAWPLMADEPHHRRFALAGPGIYAGLAPATSWATSHHGAGHARSAIASRTSGSRSC